MTNVSVVIPTYNRCGLLPRALASVFDQSVSIHEVIVVDDGSTDGTLHYLNDLASREPRLRIVQLDHGGANRARNAGISKATGFWVAFLDSDDWWEPTKVQRQLDALAAEPAAVAAYTGLLLHGKNGQRIANPKKAPSLMDLRCYNTLSSTSSALIRRDAIDQVHGFDPELPSCQDWDLWFRLRSIGPFVVIREPLTHYDAGNHSRITNDISAVLAGHEALFNRLRDGVSGFSSSRRIRAWHKITLANVMRSRRRPLLALSYCAKALAIWPVPFALKFAWLVLRDEIYRLPTLLKRTKNLAEPNSP